MRLVLGLASLTVAHREAPELGTSFGPENCVSVSLLEASKTCALQTECQGKSTDDVTFAFTCETKEGHFVLHSYGKGGFEPVERFDTEVKCEKCFAAPARIEEPTDRYTKLEKGETDLVPTEKFGVENKRAEELKAAAEKHSLSDDKKEHFDKPRKAHYYGPAECVATYRNPKSGTCVVHTACSKQVKDFQEYNMGLTCGKKDGSSERHIFGKGAFAPKETFDTLLKCDLCLGLEKIAAKKPGEAPKKEAAEKKKADPVEELEKSVEKVASEMKEMSDRVAKLEAAVQF